MKKDPHLWEWKAYNSCFTFWIKSIQLNNLKRPKFVVDKNIYILVTKQRPKHKLKPDHIVSDKQKNKDQFNTISHCYNKGNTIMLQTHTKCTTCFSWYLKQTYWRLPTWNVSLKWTKQEIDYITMVKTCFRYLDNLVCEFIGLTNESWWAFF